MPALSTHTMPLAHVYGGITHVLIKARHLPAPSQLIPRKLQAVLFWGLVPQGCVHSRVAHKWDRSAHLSWSRAASAEQSGLNPHPHYIGGFFLCIVGRRLLSVYYNLITRSTTKK